MTLCLSWMRLHLGHSQSLYLQVLLWPLSHDIRPWFLHLAHLGRLRESSLEFILVRSGQCPTVLYQRGAVSDWERFNICDTFQMDLISGLLWGVPASSSLMRWYIDTVPIGRLHQRHRILSCYWLTGAASVSICSDVVTHHVTDEQLSKYYQHYVSLTTLGST